MPAEFLGNLPKNLTTHLTHKLCAVLPQQFSDIPESEMAEQKAFSSLPDNLTYPAITPVLFQFLFDREL